MARFYISHILNKYNERDVINIFKNAGIGEVEHVYFYRSNVSSSSSTANSRYHSAVVYMHGIFKTDIGRNIYDEVLFHNGSYTFFPELGNNDISWILTKQDTNMLCYNKNKYTLLEDKIAEQQEDIRILYQTVNELKCLHKKDTNDTTDTNDT